MPKNTYLVFISFAVMTTTCCCEKHEQTIDNNKYIEVEFLGTGINCNLALLKLSNDDYFRYKNQLGNTVGNTYYVIKFPEAEYKAGSKIKVNLQKCPKEELPICITLGPSYGCAEVTGVFP